ncbi:hypothetical protein B0H10DRAFT_1962069 [Mycena sp. CBHHK59/15]|nr:hypothetical protein B0H10DRAFT_1962069 [Mycena sp. CBHHK59/15]
MCMSDERAYWHFHNDTQGTCSQVVSGRTGSKGKAICPFNHHKNGLPYVAKVEPLDRECVRKFGPGATVNKVENAQSTKDLLGGKTPSLFHPGLISRDTKTRIIQELKAKWNDLSSTAANTRQQVATYIADQEALSDEKRYLQSSLSREGKRIIFGAHPKLLCSIHDLRALDCDTTFKPVAGEMREELKRTDLKAEITKTYSRERLSWFYDVVPEGQVKSLTQEIAGLGLDLIMTSLSN